MKIAIDSQSHLTVKQSLVRLVFFQPFSPIGICWIGKEEFAECNLAAFIIDQLSEFPFNKFLMYNLIFRIKSHYLMELPPEKTYTGLQLWWAFVMLLAMTKCENILTGNVFLGTKKTKFGHGAKSCQREAP